VPDSEFDTNLTRFDVPVSALAYGPDGKMLVAACEDGTLKLVQVAGQRVRCSPAAGPCSLSMLKRHCIWV
jgi:Anaphase-promoting complex subunit 4 WD40 domain